MKTSLKTVAINSPTSSRTAVPVRRNSRRWLAGALSLLCLGALPDARAAMITYTNAAVTAWTLPTSWNPNTTWGAVTNATVWGTNTVNLERRLHIGGLAGVTANATYTANEGVTTFDVSPAGGESRALLLATNNSGSAVLNITGGTLRCVASGVFNAEVLVGGGGGSSWNGSATLNVNGGIFDAATCDVDILPRGTNTPSAAFTVNSGTAIHGVTTFGNLGNINGPAELNLNGGTLVTSTIKLTSGRAINSAGSIAINLSGGELQAATNSTVLINGPSFALNGGTFAVNLTNSPAINTPGTVATTISAAMTGPGGFTKTGSGTLTLSADNSYSGLVQVNEGRLVTTGANSGGNYAVANGASLSASGTPSLNSIAIASGGAASFSGSPSVTGISVATGSTLSVSGAGSVLSVGNFTNALNATNAFAMGAGNPTATPLAISGALAMNGNVVINVTGVGYTAGSYVLISYPPGSRSGAGSFVAGSLPLFGSIVDDTVNGQVLLNYSGNSVKLLSWSAGDGNFDFATPNWQNTVTASPDTFVNGDYVTFGDLGGGSVITVTADTAVSPGQIVINNSFPDYHFQGSVGLGGTSGLTKIGSRPAYLDGANSYSGPTLVGVTGSGSDSVLVVNHGGALGAGGAGNETIVSNTATLLLAGGITVPSENISLSGGGFSISGGTFGAASRGALQSLSGSNVWNGNVTLLASGSRIGCQDNASITINGVISGNFACVLRPGVDSTIRLNQQNTWAGNSQLFGSVVGGVTTSTILLGTNNALPALRLLHSNCRLDLNGFNQLVDGIAANGGTGSASFILNNGATPSTLTLSNTADASWDGLIQDGSAALALVKAGPAQQSLAGSNSFSGGTLVSSGILELQNASAAGSGTIADNSTLVLNLGGTVANAISGSGAVIKMGTGTAILSGASSYTGPTTVSNGTLHVTTAQTGAGSFIVADARTLGIDLHANGGSLSMASLTLGTNSARLNFSLGTFPNLSAAPVNIAGDLNLGGDVVVNVDWPTGYTRSTNVLLTYSGARNGSFSFVAGTLPIGATLVDDIASKQLKLVVIDPVLSLAWQAGDGDWDFTSGNWSNLVTASLSDVFTNGSYVQFADTAAGTSPITVNLPGTVAPFQILVNNTAKQYSLGGAGDISGAGGITKSGSQLLTLSGSNTFTGPVLVSAGAVRVTDGSALGAGAGTTTVASNSTLALSGGVTVAENIHINGGGSSSISGTEIVGALRGALQSSSGSNVFSGNITLDGNVRIGAQNNATLNLTGTISDGGNNCSVIFRCGSTPLFISGAGNSWGDNTDVYGNTLKLGANNALSVTSRLRVGVAGLSPALSILDLNGFSQTVAGLGDGSGPPTECIITNGGGGASVLTLNPGSTNANTFSGIISDGAATIALAKNGTGTQTLAGTNTYSGGTTINGGELRINGKIVNSAVTVNAGGTLGGTGTIDTAVVVNPGGTLSPGAGAVGTLTLNNALTLTGTTLAEVNFDSASNDLVYVNGNATYGGTLVVTNVGVSALTNGAVLHLFSVTGTRSGNFSGITVVPEGLTGTFDPASGNLTLSSATPPVLNVVRMAGNLVFSWTGNFKLQAQTNALNVGLQATWFDYPNGTNGVTVPISASNPTVFFRLITP